MTTKTPSDSVQVGICGSCGVASRWEYQGGFGRGALWQRCTECEGDHEAMGYGLTSMVEAEARQATLTTTGSVLAVIGLCGTELLPCGVCVVCEEQESSWQKAGKYSERDG